MIHYVTMLASFLYPKSSLILLVAAANGKTLDNKLIAGFSTERIIQTERALYFIGQHLPHVYN